jgi:hypothetical protein
MFFTLEPANFEREESRFPSFYPYANFIGIGEPNDTTGPKDFIHCPGKSDIDLVLPNVQLLTYWLERVCSALIDQGVFHNHNFF